MIKLASILPVTKTTIAATTTTKTTTTTLTATTKTTTTTLTATTKQLQSNKNSKALHLLPKCSSEKLNNYAATVLLTWRENKDERRCSHGLLIDLLQVEVTGGQILRSQLVLNELANHSRQNV